MLRFYHYTLWVLALCYSSMALAHSILETRYFSDLQERKVSLVKFKGKVVVLNFWATWCAPCRQEMPMLDKLRFNLSKKNIEVVGIALDDAADVKRFLSSMKVRYPILLGNEQTLSWMKSLGNPSGGLPFTLILNRQGAVVEKHLGILHEEQLIKQLKRYW